MPPRPRRRRRNRSRRPHVSGDGTVAGHGHGDAAEDIWYPGPGEILLASTLFVVASAAVSFSFVFYESLLPHIASADEVHRVSTAGYAVGYFASGLLLIVILPWIQQPACGITVFGYFMTSAQHSFCAALSISFVGQEVSSRR